MSNNLRQQIETHALEINMGWATFPIIFEPDLTVDGEPCFGMTDFDLQEVRIDPDVAEHMLRQTLIHESWHIIWSTMGLRTHDEDAYADLTTNQEFLVEQTTRGLLLFQQLNPLLYRLLYNLYD